MQVPNNYETDLIFPIIEKAAELANVYYALSDDQTKLKLKVHSVTSSIFLLSFFLNNHFSFCSRLPLTSFIFCLLNFQIIGDHMRAVVFLISDGVIPSNIGRGYVVRRLIRRVVRTGRLLGIKGDGQENLEGVFTPAIAEKVIELSSQIDPEVKDQRSRIQEELKREESRFVQTLERGEKLLEEMIASALLVPRENGAFPYLAGKDAFLLYDTYGFPVEITIEVAEEQGVTVDMDGFNVEMEKQRRQSQAAHNAVKLEVGDTAELSESISDTKFLGYDLLSARAVVKSLLVNGKSVIQVPEGSNVEVLLDKTPFYAESGGQIGDHGLLYVTEGENQRMAVVEIKDVQKSMGNIFVHRGTIKEGVLEVGKEVEATVDAKLRQGAKVLLLYSFMEPLISNPTGGAQ